MILVHGTLENMNDNWQAASPILANHGYCVFAFNYGGSSAGADFQGTGDIAASAISWPPSWTTCPAHPVRLPCVPVRPLTGSAGPAPNF